MDKLQIEKLLKIRAAAFADTITCDLDSRLKVLLRNSLIAGWTNGYAAALADVASMHADAGEVKH